MKTLIFAILIFATTNLFAEELTQSFSSYSTLSPADSSSSSLTGNYSSLQSEILHTFGLSSYTVSYSMPNTISNCDKVSYASFEIDLVGTVPQGKVLEVTITPILTSGGSSGEFQNSYSLRPAHNGKVRCDISEFVKLKKSSEIDFSEFLITFKKLDEYGMTISGISNCKIIYEYR
ncbi:MAG: hypothetical protein DWQ06_16670 [Calditrichaeota bacterium]|nr:MAG: hypothetical protein DWQ06_16670 [Calditrichota bacterium]